MAGATYPRSNRGLDAGWFARLDDRRDLVRLGVLKVRLDELIAAAFNYRIRR